MEELGQRLNHPLVRITLMIVGFLWIYERSLGPAIEPF